MTVTRIRRLAAVLAVVVAGGLLASCSSETSSRSAGDGLPADASESDYRAAFEDLEPIVLHTQVSAPQGALANEAREAYYAAIEEWSGGKIDIDVAYSFAISPYAETDRAVADGRLDFAFFSPRYKPDFFPTSALLEYASVVGDGGPISYMATPGFLNEFAAQHDEFAEELAENDMVPLLYVESGGTGSLFCTQPRDSVESLQGALVAVTGRAAAAQMEALGMTTVSMPFTEQFEALQRGAIDCVVGGPSAANTAGLIELAPYMLVEPSVPLTFAQSTLVFSQDVWDSLPLVARQLLFDRLPIYVAGTMAQNYANLVDAIAAALDAGGSVSEIEGAEAPLRSVNDELLDEFAAAIGQDDVESELRDLASGWLERLADAGYDDWDGSYEELVDAYERQPMTAEDFESFAELYLEPMQAGRPA